MNRFLPSFLFVSGILGLTASQSRAVTNLVADITHAQETTGGTPLTNSEGGARPLSFGNATFVLNDAQTQLTFTATIFNIDVTGSQTADTFDNLVSAHIHAAAAPGINASVRWGFFGAPDNDNNPDDLVLTPFATGVGGTFTSKWDAPEGNSTTLSSQLTDILAGLAYINFHTTQFGGGEIRGQIIAIPEPGVSFLIAGGLFPLLAVRRTRKRKAGATGS